MDGAQGRGVSMERFYDEERQFGDELQDAH